MTRATDGDHNASAFSGAPAGEAGARPMNTSIDTSAAPVETPTLARNVVHFVRVLRGAGLPMSPAQAVDALAALHWIDISRRDDVRAALATLLVCAPDERDLFNAAFDLFWRDPDWEGKLRALLLPKVREVCRRPNATTVSLTRLPYARHRRRTAKRHKKLNSTNCTRTSLSVLKNGCVIAISTRFPLTNGARCGI